MSATAIAQQSQLHLLPCCFAVSLQVRLLTRAYKVLASIAKAYQLPKPAVAAGKNLSKEFEDLVSLVHKDLTHRVYHFLTDEQEVRTLQDLGFWVSQPCTLNPM